MCRFTYGQNYAIQFDGIDDYVNIPNSSSLNPTGNITVECWVKRLGGVEASLIYKYFFSGEFGLWINYNIPAPRFTIYAGGSRSSDVGGSAELPLNEWHHLAGTYDGTTVKLYVDGKLVGSANKSGAIGTNSNDITIGGNGWPAYFNGVIDEVRISNVVRYTANFTPQTTKFNSDSNTLLLLHFDEGSGTTTDDASPNNNNGTLVNGPKWVDGFVSGGGSVNNPPNPPTNIRCDGLINPTNISDLTPDFTWTFSDPDTGDSQSAYRLLVADSQSNIDNNNGNKWDSGKINTTMTLATYSGSALAYGGVYYWKVTTWDSGNLQSPYSQVGTFSIRSSLPASTTNFAHPYGVNNWNWPLTTCQKFQAAHIDRYRIMIGWAHIETSDNNYNWNPAASPLETALNSAYSVGAKVSLCVYVRCGGINALPSWVQMAEPGKILSFSTSKYAEFITALLNHCRDIGRINVVEAVEILNEEPTCDANYTNSERDPSWYYANILKAGYNAVKSFNSANGTNILVVMDAMWLGAYHHLDDIYQLGLKDYFDRINFHHYVQDFGAPEDPAYTGSIWHYPTSLRYIKYLAEENSDFTKYIWITEFGWRITDETKQANYLQYILDISRQSGFLEHAEMYVGTSNSDSICMIWVNNDANPTSFTPKQAYNMYVSFGNQYPTWGPNDITKLPVLTPASDDIDVENAGFETGTTAGWDIVYSTDTTYKHSGLYSGKQVSTSDPASIRTKYYPAEPNRLYEIIAWIKIDAPNIDTFSVYPRIVEEVRGSTITTNFWDTQNYYGLTDTRNYPDGGWRRVRFIYLTPSVTDYLFIAPEFYASGSGAGTFWVDDLVIKSLDMSNVSLPGLTVAPSNIKVNGENYNVVLSTKNPVFSWTFNTTKTSDNQTAYRIIIADNLTDINNCIGNIFDTNKVNSSANNVQYTIDNLQWGTTYYWKVMTWDISNSSSPYSTKSKFSMMGTSGPNHAPYAPTNLKCNGATNPTNVTDFTPDLSWVFSDPDFGDYQSAYLILVADNLSALAVNNGNMWNTYKQISSANTVTYAGSPLSYGKTYYWKVTTWDSSNVQGAYSSVGTFTMESAPAPNKPTLTGPIAGKIGISQQYTAVTTDPGGQQIYYTFDWGDTTVTTSSWVNSGTQVTKSHIWLSSGVYTVRVKATNINNGVSDWSDPISLTITPAESPVLYISTKTLNFGELLKEQVKTMTFTIINVGSETLKGTISSSAEWIAVDPKIFESNDVTVSVTVDESLVTRDGEQYMGIISITSNGGDDIVTVYVTGTCVLIKPNPYNPETGTLKFFGSGIVPNNTRIKIYTLSGEQVKELYETKNGYEIEWDGRNELGEYVIDGIYIYVSESPKEKNIGKITVLRKFDRK